MERLSDNPADPPIAPVNLRNLNRNTTYWEIVLGNRNSSQTGTGHCTLTEQVPKTGNCVRQLLILLLLLPSGPNTENFGPLLLHGPNTGNIGPLLLLLLMPGPTGPNAGITGPLLLLRSGII